ncbi:MAG TPA: hypothetical protein VLF18_13800 [Tahibacter sp.]|uniref:hypothetical protein n=1 Tax=Tahibacter sp. TaxID=2056211 RepID=UPI002C9735A8|nr:hypothetical protein [Tahibacter sp.]HSX61269.1 hypothetical protein [Tahibacter sp.]
MKPLLVTSFALVVLCAAGSASASHPHCRAIRGVINDVQVTDGCASPNGFCAAGTVDGNRNFRGTTYFVMDGAVRGPATAPGTLATSGLLTYAFDDGTLVVRESGLSGFVQGDDRFFTAFQQVESGTGRYAGATGHFYVLGQALPDRFEAEIDGELCVRRAQ